MFKHFIVGLLAIVAATVASPALSAKQDRISAAAESGIPMSQRDLYKLYRNKTWLWGRSGAGHFAIGKRAFRAWTRNAAGYGYGEGTWFIPGDGKACFRAKWVEPRQSVKTQTCFEHRADARRIYQRRLPSGDWYVFRHGRSRNDDEYSKLRQGDLVTPRLRAIKRRLSRDGS